MRINSVVAQKIKPYLSSDELLYWAGMPNTKVIFHSDDLTMIPFSLMWTGFFVFGETQALKGGETFMKFWDIPFLVMGNYMVWGRFLVDAWIKRRTYYAVTNRRILIIQDAWHAKTFMTYLSSIPSIEQEGNDCGTLWLGPKLPILGARGQRKRNTSRFVIGDVPVFADIDDVSSVYRLIFDLRNRAKEESNSKNPLSYKEFGQ